MSRADGEDEAAVVRLVSEQIGFYFSDANLSKDQFLLRHTGPRGTGGVEVRLIAGFKRVRALTTDPQVVQAAIEARPDELALEDGGTRVRRVRELPVHDDCDDRTVYVEPLLAPGCTHDLLRQVFSPHGSVVYVSLPRLPSGDTKGFGFVEYRDADCACAAVAALNGAADTALSEAPLRVLHMHAWRASKQEYKKARAAGQQEAQAQLRAQETAAQVGASIAATTAAEAETRHIVCISDIPKGAAIKPLRHELRARFGEVAPVEFVDLGISHPGKPTVAFVRMATPVGAAEAHRVLSAGGGLQLCGAAVRIEVLRGEALTTYLERANAFREQSIETRKAKRAKWWGRKWGNGDKVGVDAANGDGTSSPSLPDGASSSKRPREPNDQDSSVAERDVVDHATQVEQVKDAAAPAAKVARCD